MDQSLDLENSKQRFKFETWPRRLETYRGLNVRGFALDFVNPASPWVFEERVATDGGAYADYLRSATDATQRVMIRVSEHQGHVEARLALLNHLTHSMSVTLPRLDERGIALGDVGFCGHGDVVLSAAFVRHNILITVASIGDSPVSVLPLAMLVDTQIKDSVSV